MWPVVTLALVWCLRVQLRSAFSRMTRVETPAGAIEFAAEAREVLNQAESVADVDPLLTPPSQQRAQQTQRGPESSDVASDEEVPDQEPVSVPGQRQRSTTGNPNRAWPPPPPPTNGWSPPPFPNGWMPRPEPEEAGTTPGDSHSPESLDEASTRNPPQAGYGWNPLPTSPRSPALEGPSDGQGQAPSWRDEFRIARDMVDASPVGAVVTAWNALYAVCVDVLTALGHLSGPSRPADVGRALVSGGLSSSAAGVFARLRRLRNRAVHEAGDVTPGAARDFVDSCLTVAREVDAMRKP